MATKKKAKKATKKKAPAKSSPESDLQRMMDLELEFQKREAAWESAKKRCADLRRLKDESLKALLQFIEETREGPGPLFDDE